MPQLIAPVQLQSSLLLHRQPQCQTHGGHELSALKLSSLLPAWSCLHEVTQTYVEAEFHLLVEGCAKIPTNLFGEVRLSVYQTCSDPAVLLDMKWIGRLEELKILFTFNPSEVVIYTR